MKEFSKDKDRMQEFEALYNDFGEIIKDIKSMKDWCLKPKKKHRYTLELEADLKIMFMNYLERNILTMPFTCKLG